MKWHNGGAPQLGGKRENGGGGNGGRVSLAARGFCGLNDVQGGIGGSDVGVG